MDGQRIGSSFRAVRLRRGWRQSDVAAAAHLSDATISRLERGHVAGLTVETLQSVALALDIRVDVTIRWHGGDLDRLLNARHSALHEAVARWFAGRPAWSHTPEASFNVWGERGVVDILAWHESSRSVLVIELKTAIVDVQELLGALDRKRRLAPRMAADRGWPAVRVGCWLIVAESRTNRRHLARHAAVLRAALPSGGREMAAWLQNPSAPMAALSIWPDSRGALTGQQRPRRGRCRRAQIGRA